MHKETDTMTSLAEDLRGFMDLFDTPHYGKTAVLQEALDDFLSIGEPNKILIVDRRAPVDYVEETVELLAGKKPVFDFAIDDDEEL